MYFSIFNLIVLFTIIHQSIASEWNYGEQGPDVWSDTYPLCAGLSQSPIDIKTACTIYQSFKPFQFSPAYNETQNFKLVKNGHTISGTYTGSDPSLLTLTGGGLSGTFTFSNFHLHWGENYKSGSEHQVNGKKYSGEMHFVHVNPTTNQTAVLGMFIQSKIDRNTTQQMNNIQTTETATLPEWKKYLFAADKLPKTNNSIKVDLNLALLFNHHLDEFWRYKGSLTTPPCTENIIWTFYKEPIIVNDNHFRVLRHDIFSKGYRSPQRLYDRKVYRNFLQDILPSRFDSIYCLEKD